MTTTYIIEPLNARHDRSAFSCGNESLNDYLRERAGQDAKRHVAAVFVAIAEDTRRIGGYYTLSATSVHAGELPPEAMKKLPRYPVLPATMLGRLAVDGAHKGRALGRALLCDALRRAWRNSLQVASMAVVVDAIDAAARDFYRHFGFLDLPDHANRLYLPMSTIQKLFSE